MMHQMPAFQAFSDPHTLVASLVGSFTFNGGAAEIPRFEAPEDSASASQSSETTPDHMLARSSNYYCRGFSDLSVHEHSFNEEKRGIGFATKDAAEITDL